jgi:hypothetical protein
MVEILVAFASECAVNFEWPVNEQNPARLQDLSSPCNKACGDAPAGNDKQ